MASLSFDARVDERRFSHVKNTLNNALVSGIISRTNVVSGVAVPMQKSQMNAKWVICSALARINFKMTFFSRSLSLCWLWLMNLAFVFGVFGFGVKFTLCLTIGCPMCCHGFYHPNVPYDVCSNHWFNQCVYLCVFLPKYISVKKFVGSIF